MKTAKKFLALILAAACMMSLSIAVFATETDNTTLEDGTYTVTANVYVAKGDNVIKVANAYLTDTAVPPTTAPSLNATMVVKNGDKTVTVDINNETFALLSLDTSVSTVATLGATATSAATGGSAATANVTGIKSGSYGDFSARISQVSFNVPELDTEYRFESSRENVCYSLTTALYVGVKTFPITLRVDSKNIVKVS